MESLETRRLRTEPIRPLLVKLTVPSVLATLITALYSLTDAAFIGRLGTPAIGAITVSFPMLNLIGSVGIAFGVGGASYISRMLGKSKESAASETAGTVLAAGCIISLSIALVLFFNLRQFLIFCGATNLNLEHALHYSRILVFGSVITVINMCFSYIVRGEGNVRYSTIAMISGTVINIILDPLFIFVFSMGIRGAAYATVVGQSVTFFLYTRYYRTGSGTLSLKIPPAAKTGAYLKEILKIGVPSSLNQLLITGALMGINLFARTYGEATLGALGITIRIFFFAVFLIFGYCRGLQPLLGYAFGSGNGDRLSESIRVSITWLSVFSLLFGLALTVFPVSIMRIFSSDQELVMLGSRILRAAGFFFPFFGFEAVLITLFQAVGAALPAALLLTARQGVLIIPFAVILFPIYGFSGIVFSIPAADSLTLVLALILGLRMRRRLRERVLR